MGVRSIAGKLVQSTPIQLGYYLIVTSYLLFGVTIQANTMVEKNCDISENWQVITTKESNNNDTNHKSIVAIDLNNEELKLNHPFAFQIAVCNKDDIEPNRISVDAIMPAHQHGMNYTPTITQNIESKLFNIEGLLFHMPGLWEITISNYYDEQVTHHIIEVTIN